MITVKGCSLTSKTILGLGAGARFRARGWNIQYIWHVAGIWELWCKSRAEIRTCVWIDISWCRLTISEGKDYCRDCSYFEVFAGFWAEILNCAEIKDSYCEKKVNCEWELSFSVPPPAPFGLASRGKYRDDLSEVDFYNDTYYIGHEILSNSWQK